MRRTTVTWLLLMAATTVSTYAFDALPLNLNLFSTFVLLIAFIKVFVVGWEFMDLRTAPIGLWFAGVVWTTVVCSVLVGLFWVSGPGSGLF